MRKLGPSPVIENLISFYILRENKLGEEMNLTSKKNQVFIYRNYVDMRKGHNGLAALVMHEMNLDLLSGAVFLFAGRNRRSAKALMWDGTGLLLIHKKLESGKFMSFRNLNEIEEVSETELSLILEGCKINLPLSAPKVKLKF